jgi:hypothetical protein
MNTYPVHEDLARALSRRFRVVCGTPEQTRRYYRLQDAALAFATEVARLTPLSREQGQALDRVSEAVMWAAAAIADDAEGPPNAYFADGGQWKTSPAPNVHAGAEAPAETVPPPAGRFVWLSRIYAFSPEAALAGSVFRLPGGELLSPRAWAVGGGHLGSWSPPGLLTPVSLAPLRLFDAALVDVLWQGSESTPSAPEGHDIRTPHDRG